MLNEVASAIKKANTIVIMGHKNADGDSLCSMLAMGHFIKNEFGKEPMLVFEGVIPDNLRFLSSGWWLKKAELVRDTVFDLAISLDTADTNSLNDADARTVFQNAKYKIKIDHHPKSKEEGDINILIETAATCEILANGAKELGWEITPQIARFLYAGIHSDTGGFMHDYTSPATMRVIADMMETKFDHTEIPRKFNEKQQQTFINNAETLARVLFTEDGKIAYATYSIRKNEEGERPHRQTDWLHRQMGLVKDVQVTVIFKEMDDDRIQISIRSRRNPINTFAEHFGGGGHTLAAGLVMTGPIANVVAQLIPKLQGYVNAGFKF